MRAEGTELIPHALSSAVIALALAPGSAGPAACKKATESYKAAKVEVDLAVQDYARCVAGSRGRDSCAVEFDAIDTGQERFKVAVEEYKTVCAGGM